MTGEIIVVTPEIPAEEIIEEVAEIEQPNIDALILELENRLITRLDEKFHAAIKELELKEELLRAQREKEQADQLAAELLAQREIEDNAALEAAIIEDSEPENLKPVEIVEIIPAPEETTEPEKRKRSFI